MTRPQSRNGLGLAVAEAEREVRAIEAGMSFLPDNEALYREWRRIVLQTKYWVFKYTMRGWLQPCTCTT